MAISLKDIDNELARREAESSGSRSIGNVPSLEDIDAELKRRGANMGGSPPVGYVAKEMLNLTPMANPARNLPVLGAMVGSAVAPGIGTSVGAGLGQIGARMADIASGSPVQSPVQEAAGPMLQAGMSGLPEVGGVKNAIQNTAQNLGRRSLGISKGMIKRMKGGVPEANKAAQTMLDEGVIKPFSGSKATLGRAEQVASRSGQEVGNALAGSGDHALDTNKVAQEVIDQLAPEFKGGAYAGQEATASEIIDTIGAHGNGPIDFDSAQKLKNMLKQMAGNNWNTDKIKASMYQRAYGIVSNAMEKAVQEANPLGVGSYLKNKQIYGASQKAITGLEDKVAGEASNSLLSLRGAAIGAGALATGKLTPALEALGVWEGARRVGAGTGAALLNSLNGPTSDAVRRAAMATFIDKVTTGKQ